MNKVSILRKVLFISLFSLSLSGQIVNVESLRMADDTSRWRFQNNFDLSLYKNTTSVLELENDMAIRYLSGKSTYIFLSSLHFNSSAEENFAQSGFFHLRRVRRFNEWFWTEGFVQFQTDRPLKIEARQLQGFGPRFRLGKTDKFSLYTGHLFMYEYDREQSTEIEHYDWRLSSYLSLDWDIGTSVSLTSVVYYQPRFEKFEDFRFNWNSQLAVKFNEHWAFTFESKVSYDTNPVIDPSIPNFTYKITNGIQVKF